ncbi:MAG: hypothetical protein EHM23_05150 [Acidobacteria bacterium]|nr:MAG: hypothetical protein EHM23_05150 [Acidobacteriota bacterium]
MKASLAAIILTLLTTFACAVDQKGIAARPKPTDHQDQAAVADFQIGASCLSRVDVQREFASDLNRGYVVIEVALYPENGKSVELDPGQIFLRLTEDGKPIRAAEARTIARSLQKANAGDRDVAVYPSIGIGYGTERYDPNTGRTHPGGWTTDVGVGVGVGNGGAASTDEDRKVMELELTEKGLPKGKFSTPVSGYVYFPAPRSSASSLVLDVTIAGQQTRLTLPRR